MTPGHGSWSVSFRPRSGTNFRPWRARSSQSLNRRLILPSCINSQSATWFQAQGKPPRLCHCRGRALRPAPQRAPTAQRGDCWGHGHVTYEFPTLLTLCRVGRRRSSCLLSGYACSAYPSTCFSCFYTRPRILLYVFCMFLLRMDDDFRPWILLEEDALGKVMLGSHHREGYGLGNHGLLSTAAHHRFPVS